MTITVDVKPRGVQSALADGPFDKGYKELTDAGYQIIDLAENFKKGKYYGVDISQLAINLAKKNIKKDSFGFFTDPFLSNF